LTATTLSSWAASANPDSKTVGSTVKPVPPVRRYSDTVHHLVQTMAAFGFEGYGTIVSHLARAGWRIARTTARRYLKQPRLPQPNPATPETPKRAVKARFPHHVLHLDLTEIPAFLGSVTRQLAVLLDSSSRMPVAVKLFLAKPNATQILAFVENTFRRLGTPRYLIVDQDGCFTAHAFIDRIAAWRVHLRFCSADHHRANARLERFWATLKNSLLPLTPPVELLAPAELEATILRALHYYSAYRPHSGLGGATPAEVFHGLKPQHLRAIQPPRGRTGDPPVPMPFSLEYLDHDPRLPFLRKTA
jgi:transposase InsO family protein